MDILSAAQIRPSIGCVPAISGHTHPPRMVRERRFFLSVVLRGRGESLSRETQPVERTQPSTRRRAGGGEEGSNALGEFEIRGLRPTHARTRKLEEVQRRWCGAGHGRCGQQGVREESLSLQPSPCIARARDRRTRTQRHELRRLPRRSLHAGGDHQPRREGFLGKHVQHEQEADVGHREHVRHWK